MSTAEIVKQTLDSVDFGAYNSFMHPNALETLKAAIEYLRSDPVGASQRAMAAAWIADLQDGLAAATEVVTRAKCDCGRVAEEGSDQCRSCNSPLVQCRGCETLLDVEEAEEHDGVCAYCDRDGDPDAEHRSAYYADIAGGCS